MRCPSDNTARVNQSSFWTPGGWHWDAHRIGWTVAGVFALLTVVISGLSILAHSRNYTVPKQQRQIIRILFMPPVYALISFLSYRYFRAYVYFALVESGTVRSAWKSSLPRSRINFLFKAVTISAFLLLLVEYVAEAAERHDRSSLLAEKEKRRLIFPLCCWRYRPTKEYFMHAVKWSVLQYVFVRPTITLVAIICQMAGVLCDTQSYNVHFASVYLDAIDFVSISVALYGLILFYSLTREDLRGHRPLAKFLAIKLLVFFTFYQAFIFGALEGRVIHATEYWTETNIANGLCALTICIEMVLFSAFMWWAYPVGEYHRRFGTAATPTGTPLLDCFNYCAPLLSCATLQANVVVLLADFLSEGKLSVRYFMSKGRRNTKTPPPPDYASQDGNSTYNNFEGPYMPNDADFASSTSRTENDFEAQDIPLPVYPQQQRINVASKRREAWSTMH